MFIQASLCNRGINMKTISILALLLLCVIEIAIGQKLDTVAVIELESYGISKTEAKILTERLKTELSETQKIFVFDHSGTDVILDYYSSSDFTIDDIIKIGELINRKKIVMGKVTKIGKYFNIDIII